MNGTESAGKLEDAIQFFLNDRVELASVHSMADPRFMAPNDRAFELFRKLMAVLTCEEHQQWLKDFESEATTADTITAEYIYRQGLTDGMELLNGWRRVS